MKLVTALTALAVSFALPAWGQNSRNCAPREVVVENLAQSYGESRKAMGLGANNGVIEMFASDETGSWTITVTTPNGLMCIVASGQNFEMTDESLKADETDA